MHLFVKPSVLVTDKLKCEGDGHMFTYCHSDYQIFFDLTGPDGWQENREFIEKMVQLSKKKHVTYDSDTTIEGTGSKMSQCNSKGLQGNIRMIVFDDLLTDETGVLIISNNTDHINFFVESGFSTVYLRTENCTLDLDFAVMPDEIWEYNDFHNFVDNPKLRMTYPAELTGFPNDFNLRTKLIRFPEKLSIPNTNLVADVIFTGRYFKLRDNRHYHHPLSRAIMGLKRDFSNQPKVAKDRIGKLIEFYLRNDSTVSHIVFVPPRPEKTSRFIGVEKLVKTNIKLEFDVLRSIDDYPSPKDYKEFEDKYKCVHGKIACQREVSGHVLLVDDVFTSGATTAECARVLYKAGASKVTILPLAFTQHYNHDEQSVMPVIFNSDGNEYHIMFRNDNYEAFWSSKKDNGEFASEDFDIINEEYVAYHGAWSTKRVEVQEYSVDKEIKAVIFDLDNTLLQTDHLESYREKKLAIKDVNLIKQEHIMIEPNILSELQQEGIKVGIVTRSPRNYAKSLLSAYDYSYDCLIASKDTLRSKPSPDPMLKCAKKLKVDPKNIVNIGNEDADLQAGNNAGMMSLHIDTVLAENELGNILESIMELEF